MAKAKVSRSTKSNQQSEVKQDSLTLGEHLAAVLAHPDTPTKVYDGIIDGLNELQTHEVRSRAEFIQAEIDGHNLEEAKKGGAQ